MGNRQCQWLTKCSSFVEKIFPAVQTLQRPMKTSVVFIIIEFLDELKIVWNKKKIITQVKGK